MTAVTAQVRKTVLERDQHVCQWCGVGIWSHDYSLQHRRVRGMGGSKRSDTNQAHNLVLVDGSGTTGCHGYIESHREEAAQRGFTIRQGHDPATTPLCDAGGVWWLYTPAGDRTCIDTTEAVQYMHDAGIEAA